MAYGTNPNPPGNKPPPPPNPPLARHIKFGPSMADECCPKCGSSMEHVFLIFGKAKCIHPDCH